MTILEQNYADGTKSIVAESSRKLVTYHPDSGVDLGSADYVSFFDDFLGDVIADQWSAAKGSDAQAVIATVVASTAGGAVRLTSGDTTTVAESLSSLTQALNWKANTGGLFVEARVKLVSSIANVAVNIGFTDDLATSTLEEPFSISGTTITSNATDGVCFVYDTAQTNDYWHLQGVKAGTDTAINNSSKAPVADTYALFRLELDSSGNATFFIDGVKVGTAANAVTATVALTPVVSVMARTTTSKSVDVDYIRVGSLR